MSLTLADVGAEQILKKYFANTAPAGGNNLTLKLFVTNVTPADTSTAASFTEAAGGGYAAITLPPGDFTISTVAGIAQAAAAAHQFTFTGPLTTNAVIYGYFIVDADGVLIYAEKAAATFTPVNNGDVYEVTPLFQLSKGTPS